MEETETGKVDCGGNDCGCSPTRREFFGIAATSAVAVAALTSSTEAMAGPFENSDFERLVPVDKKLDPKWVAALTAKGEPEIYSGTDLEKIGMPVGGICAGQVYLGGDGRLWHWDVFNKPIATNEAHYERPMARGAPLAQGFALEWQHLGSIHRRMLGRRGLNVHFRGEYPIGVIEYSSPDDPIEIRMEGFSPFCPLQTDDSSLPATVMRFELKNRRDHPVHANLIGWLQNIIGSTEIDDQDFEPVNEVRRTTSGTFLDLSAIPKPAGGSKTRPPISFENFDGENYGKWKVEGSAFGQKPATGPVTIQRLRGNRGKGLANSWTGSDEPTGRLTSPKFTVERRFVNFLIGGGNHPQENCINLLMEFKAGLFRSGSDSQFAKQDQTRTLVVRTATGRNSDDMQWVSWNVEQWAGQQASLEIVDQHSGGWGHIEIDEIEFSDEPRVKLAPLVERGNFGTMTLAAIDLKQPGVLSAKELSERDRLTFFIGGGDTIGGHQFSPSRQATGPIGFLSQPVELPAKGSVVVAFAISWHFPNLKLEGGIKGTQGRHYSTRFSSSMQVATYVAEHFERLYELTKRWHKTWYDSTLPWWFLNRTFLNMSILATSTCHRFTDGRFYGWEGVGCCGGTCTHVWHYAHAVARLFPDLERNLRERADFAEGIGFDPKTGAIGHRGEMPVGPAVDGQAGVILRTYREHQMSVDAEVFLRPLWPKVKKAIDWLVVRDGNNDGIIEGPQHNTLDAEWFGKVPWLSSLYVAALRAGEQMARTMNEPDYANRLRQIADRGSDNLVRVLWKDDFGYFIQQPDPKNLKAVGTFNGCHIDQVFGQSWAFQVGLGRVLDQTKTRKALEALWKFNFTPDVGPFRKQRKAGRWYAMPGEAGLIMATFPFGQPPEFKDHPSAWSAMYFNECMNGFEYQVAGHMIWEGMVEKGLAIVRAIHDRYHPSRRNPYNEIECGDHYARSMASYGVFLAACGFEYDGPRGYLAFAPRIHPEDFRAAFTAAEGWGTIWQKRTEGEQTNGIKVEFGRLALREVAFDLPANMLGQQVEIETAAGRIDATATRQGDRLTLRFARPLTIVAGSELTVRIC